jgi:hypothetical protein
LLYLSDVRQEDIVVLYRTRVTGQDRVPAYRIEILSRAQAASGLFYMTPIRGARSLRFVKVSIVPGWNYEATRIGVACHEKMNRRSSPRQDRIDIDAIAISSLSLSPTDGCPLALAIEEERGGGLVVVYKGSLSPVFGLAILGAEDWEREGKGHFGCLEIIRPTKSSVGRHARSVFARNGDFPWGASWVHS